MLSCLLVLTILEITLHGALYWLRRLENWSAEDRKKWRSGNEEWEEDEWEDDEWEEERREEVGRQEGYRREMEGRLDCDWTEGQKRTREIYCRYLNDQEPKEHSRETIYQQPLKELWQQSNCQKRVKEQSWRTRTADRRTGIQGMLETRNPRERIKS